MFKSIFSNEEVNTGRQREVDRAKCVLIFCLAIVHFFIQCTRPEEFEIIGTIPYFWDSVVGGPFGAPMFIFAMGIGLQYSRKQDAASLAKRGLLILGQSMLLNVFRYLLPSLVGYAITKNYRFYIRPLARHFFGNDILQFAGLAMLLMSLFVCLKLKPQIVCIIALFMNMAAMLVNNIDFGNTAVNILMGHFIGVEDQYATIISYYPVTIWFLMYSAGSLFGYVLKRVKDKNKFYLIISPISAIIVIPALCLECYKEFGMMGGDGWNVFYHMNTLELIVCILAALMVLGFYHLIDPVVSDSVTKVVERVSRGIKEIYIYQWIIVCWVANVFIYILRGSTYISWPACLIIGICISIASISIDLIVKSIKSKNSKGIANEQRS